MTHHYVNYIQGHRYFTCADNHGVLVALNKISFTTKIPQKAAKKKKRPTAPPQGIDHRGQCTHLFVILPKKKFSLPPAHLVLRVPGGGVGTTSGGLLEVAPSYSVYADVRNSNNVIAIDRPRRRRHGYLCSRDGWWWRRRRREKGPAENISQHWVAKETIVSGFGHDHVQTLDTFTFTLTLTLTRALSLSLTPPLLYV